MFTERAVAAAVLSVLLWTGAAGADPLAAVAGVAGLARAGRWMPVRVTITTEEPAWRGRLQVAWGDARLERRLAFEAPGSRRLTLYLRTTSPEPDVRLTLVPEAGAEARLRVPVKTLEPDEPLDVCVGARVTVTSSGRPCGVTLAPADLPASMRGYEAATSVTWVDPLVGLSDDQRAALAQWEAVAKLETHGDLGLTPQPSLPPVRRGLPANVMRGLLATSTAYLVGLALLAGASAKRRMQLWQLGAATGALVVAGSAGMYAIGRVGNTRAVVVHYRAVVEQVQGAGLFTARAVAEFPAYDDFVLRLDSADTVLRLAADDRPFDRLDADGVPFVSGRVGMAARRGLRAEGVVPGDLVTLEARGDAYILQNRTEAPLEDCRLAAGLSPARVARLEPQASTRVISSGPAAPDILGPAVICTAHATPFSLSADGRPVVLDGTTTVAAFLPRPPRTTAEGESEAR